MTSTFRQVVVQLDAMIGCMAASCATATIPVRLACRGTPFTFSSGQMLSIERSLYLKESAMLKTSLALAALLGLGLAGCQMDNGDSTRLSTTARTVPELAAYAASHPYPSSMPATEQMHAAAIVNKTAGTIK